MTVRETQGEGQGARRRYCSRVVNIKYLAAAGRELLQPVPAGSQTLAPERLQAVAILCCLGDWLYSVVDRRALHCGRVMYVYVLS